MRKVGVAAWKQGLIALRGFSTPEESMSAITTPCTTDPANAEWLPAESSAADAIPERSSAPLAGNPDIVCVTVSEGEIVAANPSALTGFGYSREQLEGQSPSPRSHQWPRRSA
jgi:PAS domain-containing protein